MSNEIGNIGERLDIRIRCGADFGPIDVELLNPDRTPVNLTGCTIRGQIRLLASSAGSPLATFDVTIVAPLLGKYQFGLTDAVTTSLPQPVNVNVPPKVLAWDLELEDTLGRVTPLYYGQAKVYAEVTKV